MWRSGTVLLLWIAVLPAPLQAQVEPPSRVREILTQKCLSCHGDASPRAGLKILDVADLVKRQILIPKRPGSSELLTLVDAGAMPPGTHAKLPAEERVELRKWIEGWEAAKPLVVQVGRDYVRKTVLKDWNALPASHRERVRYLSLNHLLAGPKAKDRGRFERARKALGDVVGALTAAGSPPASLVAVDRPQESVFRIDLREMGWDRKPFVEREPGLAGKLAARQGGINVFDLVLLEYPYGVFSFTGPEAAGLVAMVRQTKMVRPVPYVHGDWFVNLLGATRVGEEVAELVGRPVVKLPAPAGPEVWPTRVDLGAASAELELPRDGRIPGDVLKDTGLRNLLDGGAVTRLEWERAYPKVVRALDGTHNLGAPILPFDSLLHFEDNRQTRVTLNSGAVHVLVETIDTQTKKEKEEFRPGDKMAVRLKAGVSVRYSLYFAHSNGEKVMLWSDELQGGVSVPLVNEKGEGVPIGDEFGQEQVIVFAALEGKKLPAGVVLHAKDPKRKPGASDPFRVRDRIVHSLYQINKAGTGFEEPAADNLVKAVTKYQIVENKKKEKPAPREGRTRTPERPSPPEKQR